MEILQERKAFLYKYKDLLNFVLLTANKSVSDKLIQETRGLPWNLDSDGHRLPIPKGYVEKISMTHTEQDKNQWNYVESMFNPSWTWDSFNTTLDMYLADPRWIRYERWFFDNWCRNPVIMETSLEKACHSITRYIAATKIQRSFRKFKQMPMYCHFNQKNWKNVCLPYQTHL